MGSAGFYFFSAVQTIIHRAGRMESETTVLLSLSKEEFKSIAWIGKTDFIFNGEVFDIRSVHTEGDRFVLNCEQDQAEGAILTALKKHTASDQNPGTSISQKQLLLYSSCELLSLVPSCPAQQTELTLPFCNETTQPAFALLHSPPPEA